MGRASSSKKVARAASTGGGRTTRGARPLGWYAAIVLVVALGVSGIVFSRAERRTELAAGDISAPVANADHWHAAYGVYLCSEFAQPIGDEADPKGIHTHADGIIHIHPFVRSASGKKATLAVFVDATKATLSDTEIQLPGGKSFKEGETKCGGKDGIVQVKVNDKVVTENVNDIKFADRQLLTIAFAPKGAELPEPPSRPGLDNLTDVGPEGQQAPPVQVPLDPNAANDPNAPPAEGPPAAETPPADGGATPTSAP